MNLQGKVIIVTGAAGGIGAASTETICEYGGHVIVADCNGKEQDVAKSLAAAGHSVEPASLDVTDSKATDSLIEAIWRQHGRLDGFVANAAINDGDAFLDHTDEQWRRVMSVNLDGVFFGVRAAARRMSKQKSGSIVIVSSICGMKAVRPEVHAAYDVTKAAVAHLAKVVGCELGRTGVRVNAIGPGYTETPLLMEFLQSHPGFLQHWVEDTPIGRLLKPKEIAGTVAFLLSDLSCAITAQLIVADGGYTSA
jgi:NAD(P)-dependent dehydrogenase (short-subunit alcohol dehydrogenase family)